MRIRNVLFAISVCSHVQEVRSYREELAAGESRLYYLNSMKKIMENQNQRIADEMKVYMSSDPQERKKSYR